MGGSAKNWRIQHNRLHHTFTNVHEMDPRCKPNGITSFFSRCAFKKIHKLQHIYMLGFSMG